MTLGTLTWPTSLDTPSTLGSPLNNAVSAPAGAVPAGATSITLATGNGALFPTTPNYLVFGGELLSYTGRTGDVLTLTAATVSTHPVTDLVGIYDDARYINNLAAAVSSLQSGIGTTGSYNFINTAGATLTGPLNANLGTPITAASTTNIGAASGEYVHITGATTITGFSGGTAGMMRTLVFDGAPLLTYGASGIVLPGGVNIRASAGDVAVFRAESASKWLCEGYSSANGTPISTFGAMATLASATTTDLGSTASMAVTVSGAVTITSLGSSASLADPLYLVKFSGALVLTHNGASFILPGAADITTVAGDTGIFQYLGSGNWQCLTFTRAPLASSHILVGNSTGSATDVAMSGDVTIANTGATTVGKIGGNTVTLAGALTTSGANALTLTTTGTTNSTLPVGTHTVAALDAVQAFSKSQAGTPVVLIVSANAVAVDLSLGNNFSLTLQATTAQTLSTPTNAVAGTSGQIAITQNGTPSTLAYGSNWIELTSGTAPAVSTTAGAQNLLSFYVFDSTHIYYVLNKHGVA